MKKNGRIVVISGASSGIGKLLKKLFVQNGDTVIGLSRRAEGENDIALDVTDLNACEETVNKIKEKYGGVDILVNNAGVGISGAAEYLDPEDFDRVNRTNYYGVWNLSRTMLKIMGRGGKIVNISSACALFALPFRCVYCASKAAVNMLGYGMRMELKKSGICVVTVCPGDIRTEFTQNRIKNSEGGARYGGDVKKAAEKVDSRQHKRMAPEAAAKKIFRIASRKNGALYIVGVKYRFFYLAQRFLPTGAFLSVTNRLFN